MKRYKHFTHPVRGESSPRRVVCIDAEVAYEPIGDQSGIERAVMVSWRSQGWEIDDKGNRREYSHSGASTAELWQGVHWCLRRPGTTLAVSWCASRLWGLAGLWEELERGSAHFPGEEIPKHQGRGDSGLSGLQEADTAGAAGASHHGKHDGMPQLRSSMAIAGGASRLRGTEQARGGPLVVIEDPPTIIPIRLPGLPGTLQIVDVRNWGISTYPVALSLPERVYWLAGFMRDMLSTLAERKWGGLRLTGGAQASAIWRHSYLTHPVWHHTHEETLALESEACYGGRCECYRIGKCAGPVYHLDYRSAYGAIQRDFSLPIGLVAARSGANHRADDTRSDPIDHCATVTVRTDQPAYPLRTANGVIYPIGTFRTTLAGPELARACARQHVVTVHNAASYRLGPALSVYASSLLEEISQTRQAGNIGLCEWLKHLLVCLPGRFAQRELTWKRLYGFRPPGPWGVWWLHRKEDGWRRWRSLAGQCWEEVQGGWSMDAAPAIAAWITSYQRVRLLEALETCGWEEVYYCDTDSVVCSVRGFDRLRASGLVGSGEPGRLRVIGHADSAEFFGVKHYRVGNVLRCSGAPAGRYDPGGDCGSTWVHAWIKSALMHHERPEPLREFTERERRDQYKGRVVLADGTTRPIVREG